MALSVDLIKNINKHISYASKNYIQTKDDLTKRFLLSLGYLSSCFCGRKKLVEMNDLKIASDRDMVINFLGCIDLQSDLDRFRDDLSGVREILREADISFALSRFGKHNTPGYKALDKLLRNNRVHDLAKDNSFLKSAIYRTDVGNIGVCACMLSYDAAARHNVRVELIRECYLLKQMGADYVIMYLDSKSFTATTEKNRILCDLLLSAGADYIVNVKPGSLNSGTTFRQKNGSVSRAVYSVGTFLSNQPAFPETRAIIRVKLRNVHGKLQAFEEGYHPLAYSQDTGFADLIAPGASLDKQQLSVLSQIEKKMPRIRRVDKLITVGKLVEVVGATMPEEYRYLEDFTVGIISARSNGHKPGDVYIRWQPHTDSNDASTYKERVKIAKEFTRATSKVDLFIITYDDLNIRAPHIVIEDSLEAHVKVGAFLRQQHDLRCVAITGSIGKTSTKDMLAEVLKLRYNTVKSDKNENIHSKISLALQRITSDCEVYIQELGGGRPGGASRHSRMVLPEATVVTNIGDAHIGNFGGDQIALMNNKLHIIDGMPEDGVVYLNGDDPLLKEAHPGCRRILYAVHNKEADYYAEDIVAEGDSTRFTIVHGGHRVPACVNVPGEHNVLNAVCAYAIGKKFDIPDEIIVQGIANFKTQGIRQNIVAASGRKLFFDCFNASSGSVESSIKTLGQIEIPAHGKRVAVVGDITGLGDLAVDAHKEIAGVLIENPADLFLFYGTNIKYTYDIVKEAGFECRYTPSYDTLCDLLETNVQPGDVVMVKGSSKLMLEYALDRVFGTRAFDAAMIEEEMYFRAESGNVAYNLFTTHATAVHPAEGVTRVRVKKKIGVVTVHSISTNFTSPTLEEVKLPDTIRHIGTGAFHDCAKLRKVEGATNLKFIEASAFKNCSRLNSFLLPETMLHIGPEAFKGCTALKELYIPARVAQIGENAFSNCPNLKITCKAGSYAEQYLKEHGIAHRCV